ncbi:Rho GTPase activation protein [Neocallimastix californiae]|uniref:Rho GTPase activation protein n=1 Tax=Neocallimastix californiae TaxID=1754190 RepID=A0A1Y2F8B7_9FUNG|nr:Rho GTPase activation protein [Neocallimastix californiae]|eukprot:ORY80148.1 Rho GTPase activation protein [Neocallimastix californiae]
MKDKQPVDIVDTQNLKIGNDHRIKIRIFEAKNFYRNNKADSYCIVTANYLSEDGRTIERPQKLNLPLMRKMSNPFNNGTIRRKGSYSSTLIDKKSLEPLLGQKEGKEKIKDIQYETKIQPCNSNPFWGEYFEIILNKNFYSVKIELLLKNSLLSFPVGEIYLYKYELESNKEGKVFEIWKPLNSKNISIKKEINENGHSHLFESINDDILHDCIVCENIIQEEGIICSQCHITTHVKCSQNLCNCEACGSIRIEYRYIDYPILPLKYYCKLKDLIVDEKLNIVNLISKSCDSKDEAARDIVAILNEGDLAIPFLSQQCKLEISKTKVPETLFRGTTFCTKGVDFFMKLICKDYLDETIGPTIKKIIKQHRDCEIDPTKLINEYGEYVTDADHVPDENIVNLKECIKMILDSIIESSVHFPVELRELFSKIQDYAVEEFPNEKNVRYSSVSAFVFLRLFSPAILNPQLFGIIDENLKSREVRTLTLISKFVQQTANLVEYQNGKESYMNVLNNMIKEYIPLVKKYINSISRVQHKSVIKQRKRFFGILIRKKVENDMMEEKGKGRVDLEKWFSSVHRLINRNLNNIKKEVDKNSTRFKLHISRNIRKINWTTFLNDTISKENKRN